VSPLVQVGLLSAAWCALHSFFVSLTWHRLVGRAGPGVQAVNRLVFVLFSTATLLALLVWIHRHPTRLWWDWPPLLVPVRWAGLAAAGLLFWLGARAHDGRAFLGLDQVRSRRGRDARHDPPLSAGGVLARIRHPWYAGALLLFLFCRPFTDVNTVWRGVFFAYTLIGTELEERKLLRQFGQDYADYRRRVPRFFPRLRPRSTPH